MKIYHNPRCSKSRETLQLIHDAGKSPEVIEYLKTPPTQRELTDVIQKLSIKPEELIRKGEDEYKQLFKGKSLTDAKWIEAMVSHPKLIERPIVVDGKKAVLGRPPENVKALL